MEKKKYKLKGHESFVLREGWLTKGINSIVADNMLYRTNKGADALGVGTNMAKSIRYWLRVSGLTTESTTKGVSLTKLGEVISKNDIYVEDLFTLWIIHANIACNFENATSWNLFFNRMGLKAAFSREEMLDLMKALIIEYTGDDNPSDRSIKDDCSAILSMYARSGNPKDDPEDKRISPFEDLGLVIKAGNRYIKKRPAYDKLNKYVLLYLIVDRLNSEGNMHIDDVSESDNMPGKILNLNRIGVNQYLDALDLAGYIAVNRTAGLDIIYPTGCSGMDKIDVVKHYYQGRK